jgi:hypothetical protein
MDSRRVFTVQGRQAIALLAVAWFCGSTLAEPPAKIQAYLKQMALRVQTAHYLLLADVKAVRLDRYGEALEQMYNEYESGFEELLKHKKFKQERFTVVFFAVKSDYEQFGDEYLNGETKPTAGLFVPRADLLAIYDQGGSSETCGILFHEAFHQFMHRYIPAAPTWLNEGLATYYECARFTDQGLSFRNPPAWRWELARKLIAQRQFVPLRELVTLSQREFYRMDPVQLTRYPDLNRRAVCYCEAYTLVDLLLSDEGGRERVRSYIAELAEAKGKNYDAITRKYFGPDTCDYLTPHWIRYVNSRPEGK